MWNRTLWRVLRPAFLIGALATTAAHSREPVDPSPDDALHRFRTEHGVDWRVRWDAETCRPRLIWGSRLALGVDTSDDIYLEVAARHLVDELAGALGYGSETLVLERVQRLALARAGSSDKVAVLFRQEVAGVPVRRSTVSVLFSAAGDLLALDSQARPDVDPAAARPEVALGTAAGLARDAFARETGLDVKQLVPADPALAFEPVVDGDAVELAWIFAVEGHSPTGFPVAREYAIAARGRARVCGSRSLVHDLQQTSSTSVPGVPQADPPVPQTPVVVEGWGQPGGEPDGYAAEELFLLNDVQVGELPMSGTYTAGDGSILFDIDVPTSFTASLDGRYSVVHHQFDHPTAIPALTATATPGHVLTFTLSPTQDQFETAWVNVHRAVTRFRDWILETDPGDTTFDRQVGSVVNVDNPAGPCNAAFGLGKIWFSVEGYDLGGTWCPNMAFSSVVWHEEGHLANYLYGWNGDEDGFNEGAADSWAQYIADDAILGRNVWGGQHVRSGWNTRPFCGDTNPECYGQRHTDGEVLMGALWKVRARLQEELGRESGGTVANRLLLAWHQAFDDLGIRSVIRDHWLVLDDDDGDVSNGTPHAGAIRCGFGAQAFDTGIYETAQLLPAAGNISFGQSVVLEGDRLVIGGGGQNGAAYVYAWNGTQWQQEVQLAPTVPQFADGFGAAVGVDGDTIVVGAPWRDGAHANEGALYVFTYDGTSWSQAAELVEPTTRGLGTSVSIASGTLLAGAMREADEAGAAFVFTGGGSSWTQQARFTTDDPQDQDFFGWRVDYANDRAVVGAHGEGQGFVYVFRRSGTTWSQEAKLDPGTLPGSSFGDSVALARPNADRLVVGYTNSGPSQLGSFSVFERTGTTWSRTAEVLAPEGTYPFAFGTSLALDGDRIAVGADYAWQEAGTAYLYRNMGGTWELEQRLWMTDLPTNQDHFGYSVALAGDTCVVGAIRRDEGATNAGKAYVLDLANPFTLYGDGTPGHDQIAPVVWACGEPGPGGTVEYHIHGGRPFAGGQLYIGSGRANLWDPLLGGYVLVDNVTEQLPLVLDDRGSATYSVVVPRDPGTAGTPVNVQWWSVDPDASGGHASSNAAEYVRRR